MKQTIQQALLQLLQTNPLSHISVKEITNEAGIHRSTFYVYYSSKETLYASLIEDTLFELKNAIQPTPLVTFAEIQKLYYESDRSLKEALAFLQHIERNQLAYRVLLNDIQFQKQFATVVHESIMLGDILPVIQAKHLAYGAIGLIEEWLQNKAFYDIEQIAHYLTRINVHALIDYEKQKCLKSSIS